MIPRPVFPPHPFIPYPCIFLNPLFTSMGRTFWTVSLLLREYRNTGLNTLGTFKTKNILRKLEILVTSADQADNLKLTICSFIQSFKQ